MILKIFSVHDKQVNAFHQPFFSPTIGSAIRAVSDALIAPDSQMARHAGDYTLYQIGEYEDSDGSILPMDPQKVCPVLDLVKTA